MKWSSFLFAYFSSCSRSHWLIRATSAGVWNQWVAPSATVNEQANFRQYASMVLRGTISSIVPYRSDVFGLMEETGCSLAQQR